MRYSTQKRGDSSTVGSGPSVDKNVEILHSIDTTTRSAIGTYVFRWRFGCSDERKEGRFLLNEIMLAGNFGKYDDRINHEGGQLSHAWEKTKHNLRLLTHYPEEVMWEPWFRLYHWVWRKLELWRL